MTSLYGKIAWLPLCAMPLLASCAMAAAAPKDVPAWRPTRAATATMDTFVAAWNAGDRAVVLSTFEPARRQTIASAPVFETRMSAWTALSHVVPAQCNPRGAFWKTAVVTFQDRRSGATVEEIVWIHLHDGGWWMYSL